MVHTKKALVGIGVSSLGSPLMNAVLGGYMAAFVGKQLQGRVQAAAQLIGSATMPLAPLLAGIGISITGGQELLVGFSVLTIVAAVLVALTKSVRSLGRSATWSALQ